MTPALAMRLSALLALATSPDFSYTMMLVSRNGRLAPLIGFQPVKLEVSRQASAQLAQSCQQLDGRGLLYHHQKDHGLW